MLVLLSSAVYRIQLSVCLLLSLSCISRSPSLSASLFPTFVGLIPNDLLTWTRSRRGKMTDSGNDIFTVTIMASSRTDRIRGLGHLSPGRLLCQSVGKTPRETFHVYHQCADCVHNPAHCFLFAGENNSPHPALYAVPTSGPLLSKCSALCVLHVYAVTIGMKDEQD